MTIYRTLSVFIAAALLTGCGGPDAPPEVASLPIRYSVISLAEMNSADDLTALCKAEEAMLRDHLQQLESFTGTPTIDNYLESANSLSVSLDNMSSAAQSLSSVHPDQTVREAGEACDQLLSRLDTDISVSRPLFDATSGIDLSDADDTTRHAVAKALLSFRLSGVDKDEATRTRIRALNDELVAIGQEFGRNIRDDVRYLELASVDPVGHEQRRRLPQRGPSR